MKIIRKKLTPDELQPANMRYDAGTDAVQTTYDGGTTWVNTPQSDPRKAPSGLRAPNPGTDPRCLAAAGMVKAIKDYVAFAETGISDIALAIDALGLLSLFVPGFDLFSPLIYAGAGLMLDIGSATLGTSFTDAVYAALLCTFDENLADDGSMNATQETAIAAAVGASYDTTVQAVFSIMDGQLGNVGFSNAGAAATASADCSTCASPASIIVSSARPGTTVESLGGTRWRITSYVYAPTLTSAGWQDASGGGFLLANIIYTTGGPDGAIYSVDCAGTLFTEANTARWLEKETFMGQDDASSSFVIEFDAFLDPC